MSTHTGNCYFYYRILISLSGGKESLISHAALKSFTSMAIKSIVMIYALLFTPFGIKTSE